LGGVVHALIWGIAPVAFNYRQNFSVVGARLRQGELDLGENVPDEFQVDMGDLLMPVSRPVPASDSVTEVHGSQKA
jgi:hypothetical protein